MKTQPAAKVRQKDVERIIQRDFPHDTEAVWDILNNYNDEENCRVHAAVLKISNKDITDLEMAIAMALDDPRDVFVKAEYPEYFERVGHSAEKFSQEELESIYQRDHDQYEEWFQKGE